MADDPQSADPESTVSPGKFNPALLIFLIFPLMGIIAALATSSGATRGPTTLIPPSVIFTPDTLINRLAPDFTLPDPDGKMIQLSTLRGKWVFLNFWATWCEPCQREMPTYEQLATGKLGDPNKVVVLAVDSRETADVVKPFLTRLKLTLPVVLDTDGKVNILYRIVQLPVTYLIDPTGIIREWHLGEMTPDYLQDYLQKYLPS
jgi:cytochrome c biogenesis protein CcmG/thiol:disulfide interchange protein DsbE